MKRYKKTVFLLGVAVCVLAAASPTWAKKGKNSQYWPAGPEIVSASGIVIEVDTGTILYEKNVHDAYYPASITKILTTLLAIENSGMDEVVTFSSDAVHKTEGSGIARDVGEEMTMEQCLYGVMLASSNECAYAVAEHVTGGAIDAFIQMMNERAVQIGCKNTHFTNCHGLPDERHYTSAYDMALIAQEAYKNETFRIICGTKTYTIPFTNKHTDEETYLQNHHQMLYPYRTRKYLYDYCLGGKTGYTIAAKNTLVTYAEKDGMTLICVVMNAQSGHYDDTRALFDFCFDNFKQVNVSEHETAYAQQDQESESIQENSPPFVEIDRSSRIILPITAEFSDAKSKIVYNDTDSDVLGSIEYKYAKRAVGKADITATNAAVDVFPFQDGMEGEASYKETDEQPKAETDGQQKNPIRINFGLIARILAAVAAVAALLIVGWKAFDRLHGMRLRRGLHFGKKERSPYKTIRQNKMWRKHRKWFR